MTPLPASTLVLVKENPLQVLLLKRPANSHFMPNAHVFPGGRLDEIDQQSHVLCAIRETAEECGLILAIDAEGNEPNQEISALVFESLHKGTPFDQALAKYQLRPNTSALHPFAQWITPEFETKRYDTHFFIARAPKSHSVQPSPTGELVSSQWVSPADALKANREGTMFLAPPTIATLEQVERAGSFDGFIDDLRYPIEAIRPQVSVNDLKPGQDVVLTLPKPLPTGRTQFVVTKEGWFR